MFMVSDRDCVQHCSNVPAVAQAYMTPALMTGDSAAIDAASSADICPRCNQQVFIAEKRQAAGKVQSSLCHFIHRNEPSSA